MTDNKFRKHIGLIKGSKSLADIGRHYAKTQGSATAFTFLGKDDGDNQSLDYAAVDLRARAIAASLSCSMHKGERALLLYPPGLGFVEAFLGCIYAGIIAVPAYLPQKRKEHWQRLALISRTAEVRAVLTSRSVTSDWDKTPEIAAMFEACQLIATDSIGPSPASSWNYPDVEPTDLAFLQFTSGSTGDPKGVMVSHKALLSNELMIADSFGNDDGLVTAGWLPLYHDMGLIGNVLQPFCLGGHSVNMSPVSFLQSPITWLSMISKFGATTSGAPNFAYDLCVLRITDEQMSGLDLSKWTIAFNGAEPIRAETLKRFSEKFAPCGFSKESFFPCYGLAEATLLVSGGPVRREYRRLMLDGKALERNKIELSDTAGKDTRTLVSSGRVVPGQQLAIVDPEHLTRCPSRTVGEIWLKSPSAARGYWNQAEATRRTFQADIPGESGAHYLRTGDLGFIHENDLYISGRLKDMIIIRGRNIYPQDIEAAVQSSHPAFRAGGGAAFSIDHDNEEKLIIVQEVERTQARSLDKEGAARIIAQAIGEAFGIQVHDVMLIRHGTLVKTSSGKIEHRTCKRKYLESGLVLQYPKVVPPKIAETAPPPGDPLDQLRHMAASILKVRPESIDPSVSLIAYGLDSLATLAMQHALELEFTVKIPADKMFSGPSLNSIAELLALQAPAHPRKDSGDREPSEKAPRSAEDGQEPVRTGLALNQKALWTLYQLDPTSSAYNVAAAIRFDESLDEGRLKAAFYEVIRRHESLRAVFDATDDQPAQSFVQENPRAFSWVRVVNEAESFFSERIGLCAKEPFDLKSGPAFRATLFENIGHYSVMLISAHHLVIDLWSMVQIIEELAIIYSGGDLSGRPPPRPYADFVALSERRMKDPGFKAQWNYWEGQLSGPLPVLTLPTDRPRPRFQSFAGESIVLKVGADTAEKVNALAKKENCTPFTLLLAGYLALLHRYTGETDICVGCPTAGRPDESFASTIGYFVNPLVIRSRPSSEIRFKDYLGQVKDLVSGALANADIPIQGLVERLSITRDPAIPQLFQTIFTLKRAHRLANVDGFIAGDPKVVTKIGDLTLRYYPLPCLGSQVDLSMTVVEADNTFSIHIEFNPELFNEATIRRFGRHYGMILRSIVADPAARLGQLALMDKEERAFVGGSTVLPKSERQGCLHTLFERQAGVQPAAAALRSPGVELTYSELNGRANRMAHCLLKLRLNRARPVVVMTDDQVFQIETILGTLKAGHFFLCLDPAHPPLRIDQIFSASAPAVIVADRAAFDLHRSVFDGQIRNGCKVVVLGVKIEVISNDPASDIYDRSEFPTGDPDCGITETSPAYLVYTSGSTGAPKGIVQSHRSFVQFLNWQIRTFGMRKGERIANWSSIVYDASYCEIFGALGSGAALCMTSPSVRYNPIELLRWIHKEQISIFQTVPSFFSSILQTIENESAADRQFESLKHIMLAGEELRSDLIRAWRRRFGHKTALWNLYGPTESVLATYYPVKDIQPNQWSVPIGREIEGRQILIIDPRGELCPVGVPGEIFIRSQYLAMGYFKDPARTADSFLANPLTSDLSDLVFRTRDCARWLEDGTVEFRGRSDGQLKIRGMRVETGEIEAQLSRYPGVSDAAVTAARDESGESRLVAYLVATGKVDALMLKEFLRPALPSYMLPEFVIQLERLPRTATNKVDRRALPKPDLKRQIHDGPPAQLNELEQQLATIWRDLLKIDSFDVRNSFFDLGGHSLLATRLINKVRLDFGVEISLKDFFYRPTFQGMAEAIQVFRSEQTDKGKALLAIVEQIERMSDSEVLTRLEQIRINSRRKSTA
ncbi:MAG: amino acid adenylation domain-containing protein [Elusimicrobiota bacterium]|nr:amino acid adenylation domain-containing protein [Elusimicrobiota bacterium]